MSAWFVILTVGVCSYVLRAVMLVTVTTKPLPSRFDSALRLVGPAAMGALVATLTLTRTGAIQPAPFAELIAIGIGFITVRRTGNVMHAFVTGLPTLWLLTAFGV